MYAKYHKEAPELDSKLQNKERTIKQWRVHYGYPHGNQDTHVEPHLFSIKSCTEKRIGR